MRPEPHPDPHPARHGETLQPCLDPIAARSRLRHRALLGLALLLALATPRLGLAAEAAALAGAVTEDRLVTFDNHGPDVELTVDGVGSVALPRGQRISVATAAPQLRYTVALAQEWQYSGTVAMANTLERLITLIAPSAHLRIVNRSDEPAEVRMAGQRLGLLPRVGTKVFGPLPAGTVTLVAIGERSRSWSLLRMTLRAGATRTAILPAAPAGLLIENILAEPARVTVDHRNYGWVDAGAKIAVLGLVPGSHDVALHGLQSGRIWRNDAKVDAEGAQEANAGQLSLAVHNETGETLRLPAALGGLYDKPLAPGAQVTFAMQRKSVRVILQGERSHLRYVRDVAAEPASQSWTIHRPQGQLRLTNGTGEAVEVAVDGLATVPMARDETVQLRRVPAGRLKLQVTTRQSGQVFSRGVFLEPGGDVTWRVTAGGTSLVVQNLWPESLSLTIDGAPRGLVGPNAIFRLPGIRPGQHRVGALTTVSGHAELALANVVDGQRTRLVLRPPDGTVRVDNEGERQVDVLVRGELLGRVEPGQGRAFAVPAGKIVAEVREVGTGRSADWAGAVAPAQHLSLPTPAMGGGALLLHNPLQTPVQVRVGRQEPVAVAAGKTVRITSLRSGEHLVEVKGRNFVQRQLVVVAAGLPPVEIQLAAQLPGAAAKTEPVPSAKESD